MKKTTKLLSVILAFVMALSCMSMMAFAAKETYQTVQNLEDKAAYSPYGTVTRLTTEERLSILFDALDNLLAPLNITLNQDLSILGTLNVDLRSVDGLCSTVDSIDSLLNSGLSGVVVGIAGGMLGVLAKLDVESTWQNNMNRTDYANTKIATEIFELLSVNKGLINTVLTSGLDLGVIAGFLKGVDLSAINKLVVDLPGAIKSIVLPLMGRQDDDQTQRNTLSNKSSDLVTVAQNFVNGLFTKPMNWTSYRVDAAGNSLGATMALPTEASGTSRYFEIISNGDEIIQYDYNYAGVLGSPRAGYTETVVYTKAKEFDTADCTTYVYRAPENYGGDRTLKWYKAGDPSSIDADNPDTVVDANGRVQSSYWLPTVAKAFKDGALTLEINGTDSVRGLVYKFAPYLFAEMAPTVLNGSAKKLIAEAFDVVFTKIGVKGDEAVTAEATATGNPDNFFTKAQEYYVWEYSDYKVIDGVPYYRYQNEYFKGEIPNNISAYYSMFNWDWNISDDFVNEFIPKTDGATWALDSLNSLVKKAIDTMIADSWTVKGVTYKRAEVFPWSTANGNADLLNNLMVCARNFFKIAPEEIVDEYYSEAQFYEAMMNGTLNQAVNGLVCELVKLIMPQIKFADNIVDQPITAIAAVVVRELCTQLMPTYNFDAMIYANYGNASNNARVLAEHTADEWLDITLYMGVNLGMYYLRNIADIGEDSDFGYYAVMSNLGAIPALSGTRSTADGDAMTFAANSYKANEGQASWLVAIDWIVDWALSNEVEWAWHFEKLVDCGSTVSLKTYENPFTKIDKVLQLLPLNQIFNDSQVPSTTYGSNTFLENILKGGIVDSIVKLDLPKLLSIVKIPNGSALRSGNIADNLVKIVVDLLNSILYKVIGNKNLINTETINSVNTLINHTNLRTVVVDLVGALDAADKNGLLIPILPIANFFVGWTTDPQKYASPDIYFTNNGGDTFFMANAGAKINITNKSAGMLLKHRNSETVDKPYMVTVKSVDFDVSGASVTGLPVEISPYETKSLDITIPADVAEVTRVTVTYSFTGKGGKQIGGDQTKITYLYISNIDDDEGISGGGGTDANYAELAAYKKYVFTTDILGSITKYTASINGKASTLGTVQGTSLKSMTTNTAPQGLAGTYFAHLTYSEANSIGGWFTGSTTQNSGTVLTGKLYKAKDGVDSETFSVENSEANGLYGAYNMGKISLVATVRNKPVIGSAKDQTSDPMSVEQMFIYYADYGIDAIRDEYIAHSITGNGYDATAFAEYEAALKEVVRLSNYPLKTDYVTTIQPQIKPAIENLQAKYNELMKNAPAETVDVSSIQNALDVVETNPDRDLNYQDYKLFEYFQYEKQRTNARNMIKAVTPPSAPEKHVDSVWGDALVDAIVADQANSNVKAGINATIVEPTAEEKNNHAQALADFRPAAYSRLDIDNQANMVGYYAAFMTANTKIIDKTFLNNEITYAEAQNYDASLYSADSWSRYTTALAAAKDAAANSNKESEIFDAKYELMVAQNKLQLKERSMKEVGYMNEELIPLIQHASAIIENFGSIYDVKSGITTEAAFAQLVKALGVKYNVSVDGKDYAGILYDRSALTFQEYDRTATAKNKRAVDGAADKLRAAIENFECTVKLESSGTADNPVIVDQTIRYITNIAPNSIRDLDALKAKLTVNGAATPVYTASKAGQYGGTGARVDLKASDAADAALYATYFVVINGDVNGDGAVDAFDAIEVDLSTHTAYYMGDVYDDAADLDGDGLVNEADYAKLVANVQCANA